LSARIHFITRGIPNIGDAYEKALASGKAAVIGSMGLKPREAWYYPTYMDVPVSIFGAR